MELLKKTIDLERFMCFIYFKFILFYKSNKKKFSKKNFTTKCTFNSNTIQVYIILYIDVIKNINKRCIYQLNYHDKYNPGVYDNCIHD